MASTASAAFKVFGVKTGNAEPLGLARDRTRRQFQSAASGRLRRTGIDRDDLVAGADELQQRGHGEIGRAHENEAERQSRLHVLGILDSGIFGGFGEFLDDAVALELGQMIDEQARR